MTSFLNIIERHIFELHCRVVRTLLVHERPDALVVDGLHLDDAVDDFRIVDLRIGDHTDEEGSFVPKRLLRLLIQLLQDVSLLLLLFLVLVRLGAKLIVALQ